MFLAGMAGLAYLFTRLMNGGAQVTLLVWLAGLGMALALPLLIVFLGMRTFFSFARPLARVMAAADAVADGDLTIRVPEVGVGEFRRLASSFNRMVGELERSDELRKNMTADVAHELRNPLHIIQGNLEGILDGVYLPDQEQMSLLLNETRQLTRLVEDLRTLSLAEAGQLSLEKEPINLIELLEDVITSFSGQAEVAGITLKLENDVSATSLMISGDAGRLDQVLGNLIANALRYTPPGGEIVLRVSPMHDKVQIQVCDNGNGIAEEDLDHIFERFWSNRGSTNKIYSNEGGSGLGLAIARELVQAQGGKISVTSQINKGTTFTIELPCLSDQEASKI